MAAIDFESVVQNAPWEAFSGRAVPESVLADAFFEKGQYSVTELRTPEQMYGPPLCRKRKMMVAGWSAQMYSAFIGVDYSGHDGMRCALVLLK